MVSELLALKVENINLKLAQLQTAADKLVTERATLVEEARKEVDAPEGHLLNTATRLFQAPQ